MNPLIVAAFILVGAPLAFAAPSPFTATPTEKPIKLKGSLPVGGEGTSRVDTTEPVASPQTDEETPWILRWMLRPLKKGMLVRLPIIDTDPNRGTTIGIMPIWVLKESVESDRIEQIHAPSIVFNKVFGPMPTYRYYWYPNDTAMLNLRLSGSTQIEREAMALYEDGHFTSRDLTVYAKFQYNVDGARRFYGFGPNTPKGDETNYAEEYYRYTVSAGIPVALESQLKIHAYNTLQAWRIWNGMTPNLPPFKSRYPGVGPDRYQQTNIVGAMIDYDSRDHGVTTSRGAYFKIFAEGSKRGFMSAHDTSVYGLDLRYFHRSKNFKRMTTAYQIILKQQVGPAPRFWLMQGLGGKETLRAYGDGRYVDRGLAVFRYERRLTLWSVPLAGVTTDFEIAPFAGLGTVFGSPGRMAKRYARPVYGLAVRAVARPQVVGSVDFGLGQEGLAAFVDINYAF